MAEDLFGDIPAAPTPSAPDDNDDLFGDIPEPAPAATTAPSPARRWMADYGLRLYKAGYRPIPIKAGEKAPDMDGWQHLKHSSLSAFRAVPRDFPNAGIGILSFNTPGVDIDVKDPGLAAELDRLAAEMLGWAPVRVGMPPKRLRAYRCATPFRKIKPWQGWVMPGEEGAAALKGYKAHNVEILAEDNQFVAMGIHPDTHRPYLWEGRGLLDVAWDGLTLVTEEALLRYMEAAEGVFLRWGCKRIEEVRGGGLGGGCGVRGARLTSEKGNLGASLDKARGALEGVPNADLHYDTWIKIGLILKGAFGDDGWALFDDWSAKSVKYSYEVTERAWDSLSPRGEVTIGTLYMMAEKATGWSFKEPVGVATDEFEDVDVGVDFEVQEAKVRERQVAEKARRQVGGTGAETADSEGGGVADDLIGDLPGGESSSPRKGRTSRSTAYSAGSLLDIEGGAGKEALNKKYAFVLMGTGHAIVRSFLSPSGAKRRDFIKEETFHRMHASATFWNEETKKAIPFTKAWMGWENRKTYLGVVFEPGKEIPGYLNQWDGFAIDPNPEEAENRCSLFLGMVRQSICGEDETSYRWVLTWLAQMFQEPRKKPPTALVLKGGKGVGKNTFGEMVGRLLGEHFKMLTSAKEVTGNFNAHMEKCLLAFVDEAFWSGDKAADSALKTQITGHTRRIERKGLESYDVPNYTRYIIAGNEDWVVPASEDERRYNCLETPGGHANDMDYWQAIRDQMDNGGYEALLHVLLTWDLKAIDIRRLLKTKALADQKLESLDPVGRWVHESLRAGYLMGSEEGFDGAEWPEKVGTAEILRYVQKYMRDHNIRAWVPSIDKIGRRIKTILPSVHRKQANDKKSYFYVLPTLDDARANFDKFIGHPVIWEGE